MNLKNKTVTVVGLGKSGFHAAVFLLSRGARVKVTEHAPEIAVREKTDTLRRRGAFVETGGHTCDFVGGSAFVVASPGVPKDCLPLKEAQMFRIPVISEIELASRFCPGKIIAVTGSNGKTTTCNLIARMLEAAGKDTVLCGNIGTPFVSVLPQIKRKSFVVLEVSSFQLEDSPSFRPELALLLNVSPNHLDRHRSFKEYLNAKKNIFRRQTRKQVLMLNFDRPETRALSDEAPSQVYFFGKRGVQGRGLFVKGDQFRFSDGKKETVLFERENFPLKGAHNLENMLAASLTAFLAGTPPSFIVKTLRQFKTLAHRMEPAGERSGVCFINDSKSTTVDSTLAALEAVTGPIVLLAGGRDKGGDFRAIDAALQKKARGAVFYGEARQKIAGALKHYKRYRLEEDFRKAIQAAFRMARRGDSLLLSPMCASFDQFTSYGERGDVFKQTVRSLGKP